MIKTDDPRLQSILPLVNGCCNPFAWSPQDIKATFHEVWRVYEAKSAVLNANDPLIAQLVEILKALGLPRTVLHKREIIEQKWLPLKALLGL